MTATATAATTDLQTLDMAEIELREVNAALQGAPATNYTQFEIRNPRGSHAVAVGLDAEIEVTVKGSTGYYCADNDDAKDGYPNNSRDVHRGMLPQTEYGSFQSLSRSLNSF